MKIWDLSKNVENEPLQTIELPAKVYRMDLNKDLCGLSSLLTRRKLFLALDGHQIATCDLRSLATPPVVRESLLKFTLHSLAALLDGIGHHRGQHRGPRGRGVTDPPRAALLLPLPPHAGRLRERGHLPRQRDRCAPHVMIKVAAEA